MSEHQADCDVADCSVCNQETVEVLRLIRVGETMNEMLKLTDPKEDFSSAASPSPKENFLTGACRDNQEGKLLYGEICPEFKKRLAQVLTDGAVKYGRGNWRKGIPFGRVFDSLLRHLEAYLLGDFSEDNLSHAVCNLMFLVYYEEKIKQGILPPELNDLENHQ